MYIFCDLNKSFGKILILITTVGGENRMERFKTKETFLTQAASNSAVTNNHAENSFPNSKNEPGDSIDAHRSFESANILQAEKEIGQQNENL